ncbi:MAG TPA: Ig-like domain-containing protein, partial [Gemmatimonadaceae bacterium]|nr:Ig-like domain-containing protein [Gemmatimonadaceae bacterium]
MMRTSLLAVAGTIAAVAFTSSARAQTGTLRVVRVTPTGDAGPTQQISVAFDRPVAGSLDRSVDPASIFHVEPAVRGRLEWRDPVTIRLTPSAPLPGDARYTVTVSNNFRAMDGSALAEPYQFTFRVHGPLLLGGTPVTGSDHVEPNQRFALVYSSPVDLPTLTGTAYVEMSATCAGDKVIRVNAVSQRPIRSDDGSGIREAGGYERDHSTDSLRRVLQLVPRAPLPRGCRAELVVPSELSAEGARRTDRWVFSTYGDFRIAAFTCREAISTSCPTGPVTIAFSNPVRGAEVAKRVRLIPPTPFTVQDTSSESTYWTLDAKLKPRVSYAVVADTALRDIYGQPLRGNPAAGYTTTGYTPTILQPEGHLLVERVGGYRTLAVQHVNVDTLIARIASIPD